MEVVFHSIENVLFHISRNFTYPNWGRSHQVRISEVLLYLLDYYPACACAARGYVIGRDVYCILYIYQDFFWNQSFISKNTHFERSVLTQIGLSSNLMAA